MDHHTVEKRVLWSDESVFQVFLGGMDAVCSGPKKRRIIQTVTAATSPKARVCHGMGLCQCPWQR